jgi:Tol biopolymer transport system component
LKRVDLRTDAISTLCDIPGNQVGGAWNAEGVILASSVITGGVWRVSSSGGAPTLLTKVDEARQERAHLYPQFLPDGRHFIYLARATSPALYVASLDGGTPVKLLDTEHAAHFAPPETLLYVRGDALVAQRLDLNRFVMAGEPRPIVSGILRTAAGRVAASAAATGVLAYARGDAEVLREGRWLDRSGRPMNLPPVPGAGISLRLSQNGRLVSLLRPTGGLAPDLWVYDLNREVPTRIAPFTDSLYAGVFSPDGSRVAYRRAEGDGTALVVQPVSGATEVLVAMEAHREESLVPWDWTPDGQAIVFSRISSGERGLYSLPLAGDRVPVPYLTGGPNRTHAVVSPDGRWMAYTSDEGGAPQVVVQSFPDPTRGKWTVSRPGAMLPRWRRDSRELYFAEPGGRFYSVSVTPGTTLQIGQPTLLFETQVTTVSLGTGQSYDVTPDGQRFLVLQQRVDVAVPITVVVNWDQQIAR